MILGPEAQEVAQKRVNVYSILNLNLPWIVHFLMLK